MATVRSCVCTVSNCFLYIVFFKLLGRHGFMGCSCKNMLKSPTSPRLWTFSFKDLLWVILGCFGQSLMGTLLSQVEFMQWKFRLKLNTPQDHRVNQISFPCLQVMWAVWTLFLLLLLFFLLSNFYSARSELPFSHKKY